MTKEIRDLRGVLLIPQACPRCNRVYNHREGEGPFCPDFLCWGLRIRKKDGTVDWDRASTDQVQTD